MSCNNKSRDNKSLLLLFWGLNMNFYLYLFLISSFFLCKNYLYHDIVIKSLFTGPSVIKNSNELIKQGISLYKTRLLYFSVMVYLVILPSIAYEIRAMEMEVSQPVFLIGYAIVGLIVDIMNSPFEIARRTRKDFLEV